MFDQCPFSDQVVEGIHLMGAHKKNSDCVSYAVVVSIL